MTQTELEKALDSLVERGYVEKMVDDEGNETFTISDLGKHAMGKME